MLKRALDAQRDVSMFSQLALSELFVRTYRSQWLLGHDTNKTGRVDKLAILPKSVGKEGSLVDAGRQSSFLTFQIGHSHLEPADETARLESWHEG